MLIPYTSKIMTSPGAPDDTNIGMLSSSEEDHDTIESEEQNTMVSDPRPGADRGKRFLRRALACAMVGFFFVTVGLSVRVALRGGGMSRATATGRAQKSERLQKLTPDTIRAGSAQAGGSLEDFLRESGREIFQASEQKGWSPLRTVAEVMSFRAHSVADPDLHAASTGRRRAQQQRVNYSHWQQILPDVPVVVFGNKSTASEILGFKDPGSPLIGYQEGEWLSLSFEPGYVAIASGNETLLWQRSSVYVKLPSGSCAEAGVFPIGEIDVCRAAAIALGLPDPTVRNISAPEPPVAFGELSPLAARKMSESRGCQLEDGEILSLGTTNRVDHDDDRHRYATICSSEPGVVNALPYTTTSTSTTTTSSTVTVTKTASPSLFCFSVFRPSTEEEKIVQAQIENNAGIVACDDCAFLSGKNASLKPRRDGRKVDLWVIEKGYSAYSPGLGGGRTTNSWLNSEVFLYAWGAVLGNTSIGDKIFNYDWVVKADPDAVLIPHRLRWHLQSHNAKDALFLRNCHGALYGAVEVFSRGAMRRYHDSWDQKCAHLPWGGWGEDMYMKVCMDNLGVWGFDDNGVVGDERCNPAWCGSHWQAAFHAYKNVWAWMNCWHQAGSPDY